MAFKIGDKVELLNGGNKFPLHNFANGGIYKVIGMTSEGDAFDSDTRKRVTIINDSATKGHALPQDLKLVERKRSKNKRISTLEKELAHTKEQLETLRSDYLKDIELLQERFQKKIKALKMVLADKLKLRQSDEQIQQDVQRRTVTCGHQVPPYKTANEQRAELIEDAKFFIELAGADNIEFAVSEKYRAVTAIWYKGIEVATTTVKCEPDKVFNADIFKAIALGRVRGLDVSEFEKAVHPTLAVGQVVENIWSSKYLKVIPNDTDIKFDEHTIGYVEHQGSDFKIINDTNAIYTEEAQ